MQKRLFTAVAYFSAKVEIKFVGFFMFSFGDKSEIAFYGRLGNLYTWFSRESNIICIKQRTSKRISRSMVCTKNWN